MSAPPTVVRSAGQIAIALTVALLGFLLATQLRAQQGLAERLRVERESDLGQILTELTARNDALSDEIVALRVRLAESTDSRARAQALEEDARAQVRALRVLLGIVPVSGPGIEMTIGDLEHTVGPEVLLDAIQELRDAGAEAIAIGGVRVVVSTAVSGNPGALRVGGTQLSPPYQVLAIGASDTLAEAMRIPGGVVDSISAREKASVRISTRESVSILSVSTEPTFRYARLRR